MNEYARQSYQSFQEAANARRRLHGHNNWSHPFEDVEQGIEVIRRVCLEPDCWYWLTTFETVGRESRHD